MIWLVVKPALVLLEDLLLRTLTGPLDKAYSVCRVRFDSEYCNMFRVHTSISFYTRH